ncbi:uncharacterized protein LOC143039153 [Oratosquilla oratoria]|uniref:uncharacterized protein LOC143039153 n=1 Tax=Oratosquilla oratoria TaxID=337810 RepID=UPI003F75DF74
MIEVIQRIWRTGRIPEAWKQGVITVIHKKGDILDCVNYRGNFRGYKSFARTLYKRLKLFTENITDYQCSFRNGSSTIDHIFTLKQLKEKYWEHNKDQYHLFVEFKQAYGSIHRSILNEFNVP